VPPPLRFFPSEFCQGLCFEKNRSYVTVEIPDSVVSTEGLTSATDDRQTDEENYNSTPRLRFVSRFFELYKHVCMCVYYLLERSNTSPIAISCHILSWWRHSHYDVSRLRRSRRSQPRSHYDIILIVTSFATELATPTVTDVRTYTYGHLTAFNI